LVRQLAFADLARWRDRVAGMADLTVSVNVAPRELGQADFVSAIVEDLAAAGLAAGAICFEITEGTAVEDGASIDNLETLRAMGAKIALDDFGTGYTSLGNVHRLPLDGLKIDRQFVSGLGRDQQSTAIVAAAISFASALGLTVTAEGIETAEQLDELRRLGCEFGQGYLFARPAPFDRMVDLLGVPPGSVEAGGGGRTGDSPADPRAA
jgi:EAL domain-containing protein (putative c-di-GMP-specific phosphodiesterase class I)